MTTLSPKARKLLLTAHVASSVASIGAVASFLALSVAGLLTSDHQLMFVCYRAAKLITWAVIVPLVVASLITGLVSSLATKWGLIRYYWVVTKLCLTVFLVGVVLLQTAPISLVVDLAAIGEALGSGGQFSQLRISIVLHAAGGLFVLLLNTVLGIYKPSGVTRYGWRKQQESSGS